MKRGVLRDRKLAVLAAASVVVRIAFIFTHRIDSDEPQHLHVAWAWSRGLVQYRDVFDNHFPLLHLLFAPLMGVMPESSAVFVIARFAMLPIALACSYFVYRIAEPLIGERKAAIAAIVFSVMPPWLPKSVEFRNDTLWIFFWLAMLALLARRDYFWSGVAAALCLLASVKALPLFLAMACGAAPALGRRDSRDRLAMLSAAESGRRSTVRVAFGFAIPLLVTALFFAAYGALDDMLYATLFFNASLPVHAARRIGGAVAFAAVAPLAFRRANVAVWYGLVMLCFWPSLSPRDFLPLVPLAAIALASTRIPAIALFVVMAAASVWCLEPGDHSRQQFVDAAVKLTTPNEYVFDLKGNAVFRRRPIRSIYDIVGRALFRNDGAPAQIVARRCCVAIDDMSHIPPATRAFLNQNFVDIGPLRVCGSVARDGAFTIAIPQTYAVVARDPARVTIDGMPYRGPRFLAAGRHTLAAAEPVTVIWWRAVKGKR
ncbi:MAG: hypothetical protein DMF56_02180 [Acidobacteria bacterium]|nr:MAG: hypothetical protein DMF56_02180 [Acidobacteriota bacterium]